MLSIPRQLHLKNLPFRISLVFLLLGFVTQAQVTRVRGTVKDAATKETMPFVNLIFKGTTIGTSTDINGAFDLQAQRSVDTLLVSFMGYKTQRIPIKRNKTNELNIELQSSNVNLREVVIRPGENPAHRIMREVIAHKTENNPERVKTYQFDVYNKIQFDLNNFKEDFTHRKVFKPFDFVFNYADTTEDGKPYLPIAFTETYAEVTYTSDPPRKQEVIKASQISGIKNASVSQFLGDMYQNVNIYDNFLLIFNKSFVSPVTDNFLRYYKYYLVDSVYIGNERCYKLLFLPKRKQDLTFTGNLFIHDSTFAVKQVNIRFNDNANINYIKQFDVFQEYERVDGKQWMLTYEKSLGDFAPFEKANGKGVFGRKTTRYRNFKINHEIPDTLFKAGQDIIVSDSADQHSESYWNSLRPDTLSQKERDIYTMVDSLKQVPRLINYRYLGQMLATGYLHSHWMEIGKYYTFVSWNDIEGVRLKFGGVTSNDFSKRLELRGWLAYGIQDERFKVRAGARYFLDKNKKKRRLLTLNYKSDLEQLSLSANSLTLDNILTSMLRRTALTNVTNVEEGFAMLEYDWFPGLSNKLTFFNRRLVPLGNFSFNRQLSDGSIVPIRQITTTEIGVQTRFAYGEKFITGEFDRTSIGTKYPVLQLDLGLGVPNVFSSQFSYVKARLRISDRFRINPMGYTDYVVDFGKIWGTAPYLFLELHQGSQTYALDPLAFNMMNIFEFASDRYAYLFIDHHFEGFFLNKVPLLRKLKWREVVTLKSVIGDMRPENRAQLMYPGGLDPQLHRPYLESGVAVENIFKIVRVDALWRMTHLDRPNAKAFGVRVSLSFRF
ncbi:MAG: hypothetical protein RLZZ543_240 [Bacteroidota bacterium]